MRAGEHALTLLSVPLNVHVLTALAEEPRSLIDLRRIVGSPPPTTLRVHLKALAERGVVERRRQAEFPGPVDYQLASAGQELQKVIIALQDWLAASPDGPLVLGSTGARSAIKALVGGWSSTIVRALAARPLALTELNLLIASLNYPSLERRLAAVRSARMIEACPGEGRSRPYKVTRWLRQAVGPLAAAAQWERGHMKGEATPITPIDAEAAFLLSVPTLQLPVDLSGTCRLAVEMRVGGEDRIAGVLVEVSDGRIAGCVSRLRGHAAAWATGSAPAWIRSIIARDAEQLEVGGEADLARALLDALHDRLMGAKQLQ